MTQTDGDRDDTEQNQNFIEEPLPCYDDGPAWGFAPSLCVCSDPENTEKKFVYLSHHLTSLRFDLGAKEWARMPQLQVPRYSHATCYLGGFVYAFGGNA